MIEPQGVASVCLKPIVSKINHTEKPTVIRISEDGPDIAARDIQVGEELTIDYRTFDADAERKLWVS